ncbi:hypothetical protein GCM10010300_36780 [Streptomyces olivaceoviridis]|uniref:hypothetical protein n=1 Tax=Streptomyces olivaceoviridis TaxID=1921 RepID=UPI00167736CE|nr:hypothetical protein [Streptomyces olivaceoviridis]GGY89272.1 hypothetical protein GCM10010300_36780 [Streptomyces olivaceoviridis]
MSESTEVQPTVRSAAQQTVQPTARSAAQPAEEHPMWPWVVVAAVVAGVVIVLVNVLMTA